MSDYTLNDIMLKLLDIEQMLARKPVKAPKARRAKSQADIILEYLRKTGGVCGVYHIAQGTELTPKQVCLAAYYLVNSGKIKRVHRANYEAV